MQDVSSDQMLHYFSRIALIVPIVVIIVGLFLFEFQKSDKKNSATSSVENVEQNSNPSPPAGQVPSQDGKTFDMNGSYICSNNSPEASTSAYYKQKRMFVKTSHSKTKAVSYVLYTKGCLYLWGTESFSGKKVCGLEQYESIIGGVLSMNILSPETIISSLRNSSSTPSSTSSASKIEKVVKSCLPDTKIAENIFNLPKNILFKNTTLEQLKQ